MVSIPVFFSTTVHEAMAGSPAQCPNGVLLNQFGCPGNAFTVVVVERGYQVSGPCRR